MDQELRGLAVSRRHVVAAALGAAALPFATPALGRGLEVPATEADAKNPQDQKSTR